MWVLELIGIFIFGVSVIAAVCNSIFIQIIFEELDKLRKEVKKDDQNKG